jgi:DNA-binding MarR family transcriptional regulator
LLKIAADRTDRRNRAIALTAKGRKLIRAAYPIWERTHDALEQPLKAPNRLRADLLVLG